MDLAYSAALPQEEFIERRRRVWAQMRPNSALLVFSEIEKRRNNDCEFPFRLDSYFWYLTGFHEPNAVLLFISTEQAKKAIMFLRPRDPLQETWHGRRLGVERAPQQLALDDAYSIDDFNAVLSEECNNLSVLYHAAGLHPWADELLAGSAIDFVEVLDWRPLVNEMRLIKSRNEIRLIQQAAQISALAHLKAMEETRPNRLEYEIESEILHEFNRHGARFAAYNSIVAGGENACILHYTENDQALKDGDLVLIDAGCEFALYAGDITRTFPVNGKFSQAQREVYALVLSAQKRAIELLVPGASIKKANDEVIRIKVQGLIELGILQGDVDELIEQKAYRRFYMHGLGHWLGLDVHDVGEYGEERGRTLEIGMVLTVEPGLYIPKDADIPIEYQGIGVRIEDDLLITEYGNKILTAAVPKEIDEIEYLMQKNQEFSKM